MTKQATKYIKMGVSQSKKSLKESDISIVKFSVFYFLSIFGKLILFLYPLFVFADYSIAKESHAEQKITFKNILKDSDHPKKYFYAILYISIKSLLIILGTLLIGGLAFGLIQLGMFLDEYFLLERYYIALFFQFVSITLLVIFFVYVSLYLSPIIYLIQSRGFSFSEAFNYNSKMLNSQNKVKLLLIQLFYLLLLLLNITVLGSVVLFMLFISFPLFIVMSIIMGLILILRLPRIFMSYSISKVVFFDDIVEELKFNAIEENDDSSTLDNMASKEKVLLKLFEDLPETIDPEETKQNDSLDEKLDASKEEAPKAAQKKATESKEKSSETIKDESETSNVKEES